MKYEKEIQDLLDELWYPEAHESFMSRQMPAFGGESANELIESGRESEVKAYLTALAEGIIM